MLLLMSSLPCHSQQHFTIQRQHNINRMFELSQSPGYRQNSRKQKLIANIWRNSGKKFAWGEEAENRQTLYCQRKWTDNRNRRPPPSSSSSSPRKVVAEGQMSSFPSSVFGSNSVRFSFQFNLGVFLFSSFPYRKEGRVEVNEMTANDKTNFYKKNCRIKSQKGNLGEIFVPLKKVESCPRWA
jgi:hypothetical protein